MGIHTNTFGHAHTILYYTIRSYTILYYIILYYTILYYIILYYIVIPVRTGIVLHYTILYYIILYFTTLYYTILYYTIPLLFLFSLCRTLDSYHVLSKHMLHCCFYYFRSKVIHNGLATGREPRLALAIYIMAAAGEQRTHHSSDSSCCSSSSWHPSYRHVVPEAYRHASPNC